MDRTLRHFLIAVALVFAQQAAQLHALSHAWHELVSARPGQKSAPPSNHAAAQCLLFHAVDSVLHDSSAASQPVCAAPGYFAYFTLPLPFAPRIEFDSRAPPVLVQGSTVSAAA